MLRKVLQISDFKFELQSASHATASAHPYLLHQPVPLIIYAKSPAGAVKGSIVAATCGKVARVESIWLNDDIVEPTLGVELLLKFHAIAQDRNVDFVFAEETTTEARSIYDRCGYVAKTLGVGFQTNFSGFVKLL